jgi:hypothetical protein
MHDPHDSGAAAGGLSPETAADTLVWLNPSLRGIVHRSIGPGLRRREESSDLVELFYQHALGRIRHRKFASARST